jgi:predicted ABC-type sugar transport system permease subunit
MTTNINGGQLVLYAVAAAAIGGTSLFGGRRRFALASGSQIGKRRLRLSVVRFSRVAAVDHGR